MVDSQDKVDSQEIPPEIASDAPSQPKVESNGEDGKALNRVIKRFGGRHLIFRTQLGSGWSVVPKPYALVSTFRGPIWFFYGIGQVWITHKKYHAFDGWMSRVPRLNAPKITALLDKLEPALTEFTHFCNQNGIEGTVVIEKNVIEFHWTFDYSVDKEKMKQDHTDILDAPFHQLVDQYLAGKATLEF